MVTIKRKRKAVINGNGRGNGPDLFQKTWILVILLSASLVLNVVLYYRATRPTVIPYPPEQWPEVPPEAPGETQGSSEEPQSHEMVAPEPVSGSSPVEREWLGLCEKNKIHSVTDFYDIVHADPLLTQHFADFNWNNATMGSLNKLIWTHLAYRKNGKIRVTGKIIRLPKGDGYITDGSRWVRTFCCNDYVLVPNDPKHRKSYREDAEIPEPRTLILCVLGCVVLIVSRAFYKNIFRFPQ